ncbi:Arylsulfotransferase (ASST) [Halomicrobium zhouii]|uniref:Arylsulfotransferase (ASST) n=1 Tax=Halomicrobium zhouii TaxID=767519 RepID=A0A1I6MBA6_9EURY|nr:arylsulfotransferase family protein [Halomicrobium zhouii]SFS13020.1 Arylsulfotransferase (ASST) [Halomicrobium zhouii]
MDRQARGTALLVLGAVLLVGTVAVGAATAPDIGTQRVDSPQTLVGSQGDDSYHAGGSVSLLEGDDRAWTEETADSYFDVTMREDGTVLAGFMHSGYQDGCGPYDAPCTKTGFRIIDPDAAGGPAVVEEYAFPVRTKTNSEIHDVEELDSGEFLLTDMDRERIFTVDGDEVTWQWNASSFYEAPEDPTQRDWLHVNDVDVVNESHYLVSVRNANQVLLIERDEGVVEVINEDDGGSDDTCLGPTRLVDADGDGDVRCGDPSVLYDQHNPQWLDDGAVLVADSENDRVVELHRNESTGEWEPAWTLTEAEGVELNWPRDADRLDNGNTLVTDTRNARLLEVTPNGTVVWSHQTGGIPYEAERLPEGERAGADRYERGTVTDPGGDVPGLSLAMVGLRSVFPGTPYWFAETHLGLVLLGLGLTVAGLVVRRRT